MNKKKRKAMAKEKRESGYKHEDGITLESLDELLKKLKQKEIK